MALHSTRQCCKTNYPSHVLLLINDETHQIAVQACSADNPKAVAFFKPKKSGLISVRWNGKDLNEYLKRNDELEIGRAII